METSTRLRATIARMHRWWTGMWSGCCRIREDAPGVFWGGAFRACTGRLPEAESGLGVMARVGVGGRP